MYGTIYLEVGERLELSDETSIKCIETKCDISGEACDKCAFYNHPERKLLNKCCEDMMCLEQERRDRKSVHFELDK